MDVTVLNRGTRTAGRTQVRFLYSADPTITNDDTVIGSEFTDTIPMDATFFAGIRVEPPH